MWLAQDACLEHHIIIFVKWHRFNNHIHTIGGKYSPKWGRRSSMRSSLTSEKPLLPWTGSIAWISWRFKASDRGWREFSPSTGTTSWWWPLLITRILIYLSIHLYYFSAPLYTLFDIIIVWLAQDACLEHHIIIFVKWHRFNNHIHTIGGKYSPKWGRRSSMRSSLTSEKPLLPWTGSIAWISWRFKASDRGWREFSPSTGTTSWWWLRQGKTMAPLSKDCVGSPLGYSLSPTIYNIVVYVMMRHWVTLVTGEEIGPDGFRQAVQCLTAFFSVDDRILTLPRPAGL